MSDKPRTLVVTLAKEGTHLPNPVNNQRMVYGTEYTVRDAPFWRRRLADGSVTLVDSPDMPTGTPVIAAPKKAAKKSTRTRTSDGE